MSKPSAPKKKSKVPAFAQEELIWPEVNPAWREDDLLSNDGMFKFSRIKNILNITTADLTKISQVAARTGINTYRAYGFGKPKGSQYIIRMSRFRKFYRDFLHEQPTGNNPHSGVRTIPSHVENANQLIELQGVFALKDICRFAPFSENEEIIKKTVRDFSDIDEARSLYGCWMDPTKREYYVEMKTFVPWFFKKVWIREPT